MDLEGMKAGRPPVTKQAMKERIRRLLFTVKTKNLAKSIFGGFRRKCERVVKAKVAAIRG